MKEKTSKIPDPQEKNFSLKKMIMIGNDAFKPPYSDGTKTSEILPQCRPIGQKSSH